MKEILYGKGSVRCWDNRTILIYNTKLGRISKINLDLKLSYMYCFNFII